MRSCAGPATRPPAGNPFFLRRGPPGGTPFFPPELPADLRSEGRRPTVEVARSVRSLGAGAVGRSVLVRIGRLGLDCDHLARALAILGPGAPLRHAAQLADLDRAAAEV